MILGPSGTGKSVCIKHMVGLLYPRSAATSSSTVSRFRRACATTTCSRCARSSALLFQDGALFGSMNLFDNVAFPLRQHTEKGEERDRGDRHAAAATRSVSIGRPD